MGKEVHLMVRIDGKKKAAFKEAVKIINPNSNMSLEVLNFVDKYIERAREIREEKDKK